MEPAARRDLLTACMHAALAAVDPAQAVRAALRVDGDRLHALDAVLPLRGRVVVCGAGKASAPMAAAALDILGDRGVGGPVVVKDGHGCALPSGTIIEASHPVPDARGAAAAQRLMESVRGLSGDDIVLCCLSGGASALLPAPVPGLDLAGKQAVTRALLASGADIGAVNTVRRHLSLIKGGGLLQAAAPARVLTLAISDVPGDDPAAIGSGPTWPATTGPGDALALLRRHLPAQADALAPLLRPAVADPGNGVYRIVASNRLAVEAAAAVARSRGHMVHVLPGLVGAAAAGGAGIALAAALAPPGTVFLAGGETTVVLGDDPGMGGRNQEGALAAALALDPGDGQRRRASVLCLGTDGSDGPTDAAGGWADEGTCVRARAAGCDPRTHLLRHDAYPLLRAAGDLLVTGPTRTNVMDVWMAVAG